ncbi:TIGR01777 family protein [Psychrobacter cryohalolentis]|uniref:TIGR01777 family oxidoreductase n=1 Tax=Psychrobacter sp. D2 TaxID=2759702 RepID=UPI0015E5F72D|nr:TIGR01777 family oxidoreductase [Psychrobacter sp. D2]MBA2056343.1 TIGR01777 family protein [Psychrobacter sp. D2]
MNILISGGSGFLGSAFSQELLMRYQEMGKALQITWLTRDSNQAHPSDITMMTYDELAKSDAYFDVILNLAGAGIADARWSDDRKEQLLASRMKPTKDILAFVARSHVKPKLLVSGSAIGWYGNQGVKPLTESSGFQTDFAHQLCDDWEQLALQATEFGVPVTLVRTGVVIHPTGGMLSKLLTPFKIGVGGQLGNGQQIMSWISRDDWVAAVTFIIEQQLDDSAFQVNGNTLHPASINDMKIYNLTAPNPVTNHTFTKTLGAWLHRPTFFTLPAFLLKLIFGEMSTLLIDGQKVLPKALLDGGFEFKHQTLKEALEQQAVK